MEEEEEENEGGTSEYVGGVEMRGEMMEVEGQFVVLSAPFSTPLSSLIRIVDSCCLIRMMGRMGRGGEEDGEVPGREG